MKWFPIQSVATYHMCHNCLSVRLSVCLSVCPYVCLYICLSLRLYLHEHLSQSVMMVQGEVKAGREFMYSSQPSAYAKQPWETVNYADCHDGQTLFDQVMFHIIEIVWFILYTDCHDGRVWVVRYAPLWLGNSGHD